MTAGPGDALYGEWCEEHGEEMQDHHHEEEAPVWVAGTTAVMAAGHPYAGRTGRVTARSQMPGFDWVLEFDNGPHAHLVAHVAEAMMEEAT